MAATTEAAAPGAGATGEGPVGAPPASRGLGVGRMYRRRMEWARQGSVPFFGVGQVAPTTTARVEGMRREAEAFGRHLERSEKAIRELKRSTDHFLSGLGETLSAPLPRLYASAPPEGDGAAPGAAAVPPPAASQTKAVPVGSKEPLGRGLSKEALEAARRRLNEGLEQDVLAPMEQWLFAWHGAEARTQELETARIDVDSRRRAVYSLRSKAERQRASLASAASERGRGKLEQGLESTWRTMQHKEAKLAAAVEYFERFEQQVAEELAGLIRDATCLQSYLAACMEYEREAFRGAASAMTSGPDPPGEELNVGSPVAVTAAAVDSGTTTTGTTSSGAGNGKGDTEYQATLKPGAKPPVTRKVTNTGGPQAGSRLYGDDIQLPPPV